ncbi:FK506-binding protein-like [Copidosoma floridanum]|uniref:FK506-binding protein-like n=1 Tax=Copidosoma floridanum TaxID=29053 RepID=UPI0006C99519|nr:FK506-binding protein-like [Copidosoma floridanum]
MMSDYQSMDKLVKKKVILAGKFSNKPTELSTCHIHVQNPQCSNMTVQQIKAELRSEIVDEDAHKSITIGNACSIIDRLIERAIQRMSLKEQSLVTLMVPLSSEKKETIVISVQITLEKAEIYKPIWEWSPQEKHDTAFKCKEKGVELFKANLHVDAFYKFSQACKILITLEPIEEEGLIMKNITELKYILYNNMAECQLIRKNYEHVLTLCNKVLNKDTNNVKAIYRRGVAYAGLKNFEQASNDLKMVITLEPKNKLALEKYNIYSEKWRVSVQGYESIVRKMFKVT